MRTNQPGWTGADDDDVTFDQLVELFIVFPGNLPGNILLAQWSGLWLVHERNLLAES